MKLRSFISRLQELNAYLELFPTNTEGQETAPLPADDIMDIIYHSMPTTWKKKTMEQGFNYANSTVKEMTDFFETREENLEPKEEKKKFSAAAKKSLEKIKKRKREDSDSSVVKSLKKIKKRKREDSNSSVVKFSEEFSVEHHANSKYFILRCKCGHSMDSCKDLRAMINKHEQKIRGSVSLMERATRKSMFS